ncbi:MAG: TRAM domain-containing protein, partial [Lachnospiraceae bacterium]|nr:TRAM domain-containing protein [Lachnospiraceae bacterium]
MKKNDLVTLRIDDMGIDGEGIGKADGLTLFIKDAVVGDLVTAKIMKLKKTYGYARLMEIIEPSKDRVEPPCPYSRACGGCQIMEMSYPAQLDFKQRKVRNNLKRIGGFSEEFLDGVMEPIVGMTEGDSSTEKTDGNKDGDLCPLRYRNKAQYPFGTDKEGKVVTGFYAGRTHSIISNDDCLLGSEVNKTVLREVMDYMKENNVVSYDEEKRTGILRHVLIRTTHDNGDIMVCLVVNAKQIPNQDSLIERLTKIEGMRSISININTENTNVILGKTTKVLWG